MISHPRTILIASLGSFLALAYAQSEPGNAVASTTAPASGFAPNSGIGTTDPALDGRTIGNLQLRFRGNKTVDEKRIKDMMRLKSGGTFSSEAADSDTKSLYDSGLVDDIIITAEPVGENVDVFVEVSTRPLLSGVGFNGAGAFTKDKLAKETKLKAGSTISDKDVQASIAALRKLYKEHGYPDVEITHHLQNSKVDGYADLIFDISQGSRNVINSINFVGNRVFSAADLRKEMETKRKNLFSFITKNGNIDEAVLEEDLDRLQAFYRDNGYLRAEIKGVSRQVLPNQKVNLIVSVYEGPQYRVQNVAFGPLKAYTPKELEPGLSMLGGDVYSARKVADDVNMIRKYYGAKGYADCSVRPDIKDLGNQKIVITYLVNEGPVVRVDRINIEGNTKTQDKVIRRELGLTPEGAFNTVELETARQRLNNLNYFNSVSVNPAPSSKPGYRQVNVNVDEKETGSLNFGVGFSTIDSVVGFIGLNQSNFDIANPWNFTGGGQRFGAEIRAGSETQNFSVNWLESWFMGRKLALGVDLFYRNAQYYSDYYEQKNIGGALSLRKPLGPKDYLKWTWTLEQVEVSEDDETAPAYFQSQFGDYLRSHLDMAWVYDSRNAQILPRKGERIELLGGVSGLGGDVKTYNLRAEAAKYWNLRWDTIFSLNGALATVDAYSGEVPIFEREFLGGPLNMRGFDYRHVGLYDTTTGDETRGGNSSGFVQLEYTIPIIEQVRFATFLDAGFVNEDSFDFGINEFVSDAGVGLRLNLPFGPMALDYAVPIKKSDTNAIDDGGQFQFYMNYKY